MKVPLIVEEVAIDHYILVDGYRRYYALEFLKEEEAKCIVVANSTEEDRIIKRLRMEFHSEKRSGFDLEKMIRKLMENGKFDLKKISDACNVTVQTIKKYVRVAGVDPKLIEEAKKAGVRIHALADLHESIIRKELKDNVFDRYLNNEFNSKIMRYIRKATNEKVFKDIPIDSTQRCIDEIIQAKPHNYETVKTIVHKNRLIGEYHNGSHTSIHNSTYNILMQLKKILQYKIMYSF